MKTRSLRFLLFILLTLYVQLVKSQQLPHHGTWDRLVTTWNVTASATGEEEVWFAMNGHVTRFNPQTGAMKTGIGVSDSPDFELFGVKQIWLDAEERPHVVGGTSQLSIFSEGRWNAYYTGNGPSHDWHRTIVLQENDSTYLLRDPYGELIRWTTGGNLALAGDYNNEIPFFIYLTQWDATQARLWVANSELMGYVTDGEFHPVLLPSGAGNIHQLRIDDKGRLWVHTSDRLLCYREDRMLQFLFPLTTSPDSVQFVFLPHDRLLLATPERQVTLTVQSDTIRITADHTAELAGVFDHLTMIADRGGNLVWADPGARTINVWRPGELRTYLVPWWLPPGVTYRQYLTRDAERRIWVGVWSTAYTYANADWLPLERFYPGLDSGRVLPLFTPTGTPVARYIFGEQSGYYEYVSGSDWRVIADTLFNDAQLSQLKIGNSDYLQVRRRTTNSFSILVDGNFVTISPSDLFPIPATLLSLHLKADGTQWIATNRGVYERFGSSVTYYPFTTSGFPADFRPVNWEDVQFSPEGTLWFFQGEEVYKWDANQVTQLPRLADATGMLLSRSCASIHPLADDDVWVQFEDLTLAHFNGSQWQYHPREAFPATLREVLQIVRDDRRRLWVRDRRDLWVFTPPTQLALPPISSAKILAVAPNPARSSTLITWHNTERGLRTLRLYSANGTLVRTLLAETQENGEQQFTLLRNGLPAGVYFLSLTGQAGRELRRIVWR